MRKRTKNFTIIQCAVYNTLKIGKENAMSRDELILATGYTDRRIREAIEALRHIRPILNLDDGDGYYIPDTTPQGRQEAALWLSRQDRRIQSMKDATTGARRFLSKKKSKDVPGQISMFGAGVM
ncbi:hypothetical protein ACG0Z4_08790 [Enterocloster aldenensis]|uniref:hypothetical protein n=1 Tax=Enterocloster aldenensis TaxID=358742 RepID=UPI004027EAEF